MASIESDSGEQQHASSLLHASSACPTTHIHTFAMLVIAQSNGKATGTAAAAAGLMLSSAVLAAGLNVAGVLLKSVAPDPRLAAKRAAVAEAKAGGAGVMRVPGEPEGV
eukprot:CAMPEP_0202414492 /NCGR_PEP_ID=MMETSP1128-20130828/33007_1 /ASSEMBLY_ACC=CAM_ASM_000463 /TAXON_ID=3047 /ORGANISM="Dunaliella tertiolecta, Strain CCMP1320" /LENGTH=108 /DNA_ID=CAMNT_0049020929 /DNA_START=332 /DNA_END=657 /DNA_ORIENTATION=-